MAARVEVPLPPEGLWLHNAALTLALEAVPSGARAYLAASKQWRPVLVVEGESPERYAASLLDAVRRAPGLGPELLLARVPGVTRHDSSKYLADVLSALCRPGLAATSASVEDLASAVADAIAGGCGGAWRPVHPLALALAEFYEFARGYGGSVSTSQRWKSAAVNEVPALAQALGLLGHVYTLVYRIEGGSIHYAATGVPREQEQYKAIAPWARLLASCAYNAMRREDLPHPVQLLAVAAAAARAQAKAARLPGIAAVRLGYGRTVSVQRVEPLAAEALYRVLEAAARDLWGKQSHSGLWETLASALAARRPPWGGERGERASGEGEDEEDPEEAALRRCTDVTRPPAGVDAGRYEAKARRYVSALREYSYHMLVYAETVASGRPARDYAYAAARVMHGLALELAGLPRGGGWGRLRGLALVARDLASLAARAALAEAPALY